MTTPLSEKERSLYRRKKQTHAVTPQGDADGFRSQNNFIITNE